MKTCIRIGILILCISTATHATTWYVSNSGSNSNNGLSPGTAFETIQFAEDQAVAGDSILVANGSYAGFYVDITGTAVDPIVFLANGNAVFITSPTTTTDGINVEGVEGATVDYIEINGFIVNDMPRNGIRLVWANNCIIRNCSCDNNFERGILTGFTDDVLIEYNVCSNSIDEHGIYVSNSSDRSILRYNTCHHNNGGGIQINADASLGGDGIATDPEIYGNILYENGNGGGAAINLDGVQGGFIYNNLLYENHATGIALFQQDGGGPSIDATVVYNTIVQATDGRWCILIVNGATGASVYNNILINQHPFRGSIALGPDAITGFNSDYNVVINSMSVEEGDVILTFAEWQGLGYDQNSMLADPIGDIFENAVSGDYHLLTDAQPVNAGNAAFGFGILTDIEGNPRPTGAESDIGAYENQSVVLALEEDKSIANLHKQRWISIRITKDQIDVYGISEGDQLCIANLSGQLLCSRSADKAHAAAVDISELVDGVYILVISRGDVPVAVRTFMHFQ